MSEGLVRLDGPVLALDTSTETGSVAVGRGERLMAEVTLSVGPGHSAALMPAVDAALRTAGIAPRELSAVVVGGGPGSFTGIRIAAASAKGMVRALGIPLFAYSGLLAAAAAHWGAGRPVCAIFDARRRDVYAGVWRFLAGAVEEVMAPEAMTVDELVGRLAGGAPPLLTGDAAALHGEELGRVLPGSLVVPPLLASPRGAALLQLARVAPEAGRVADPAGWEPEYLRASGAERTAAAVAGGSA